MARDLPHSWPSAYPRHRAISVAEARALDGRAEAEFGIPSIVLMEHASMGVAQIAARMAGPDGRILVLCGPGNNGGDGYGAARYLRSWGHSVEVLRCARSAPAGGDAGLEYELWGAAPDAHAEPQRVQEALDGNPALVVDALFGVGLSRALEGPYAAWIEAVNACGCPVLAVDVPSGIDSDSGEALPVAVQAAATATMAAPKLGLEANPTAAGVVVEIDIGLPEALHGAFLAD